MATKVTIKDIKCHKVINSRNKWTLETFVYLSDGTIASQTIPNGASKGENEAVYLEVGKAIEVITQKISKLLEGQSPFDQTEIDRIMIEADGTKNKSNLGGNSILSVSLAVAKAAAKSKRQPLYSYLADLYGKPLKEVTHYPTPVFNILNGGKHAHNGLSFQEFMVIPAPSGDIEKSLAIGMKVYETLKGMLEADGYSSAVGDEGGFAPTGFTVNKSLEYIRRAAEKHYKPGVDLFFGMDVAAESFYSAEEKKYLLKEESKKLDITEFISYYEELLKHYELIYIEDPFYEQDYSGWDAFYQAFNSRLMVVADDLVVTNPKFLKSAIDTSLANAVIVKPNQVGSLTETFEFIKMAQAANMSVIVSHRSGDTAEDTFVTDLALAVRSEFVKFGAPTRGERVVKYNRFLDVLFGEE